MMSSFFITFSRKHFIFLIACQAQGVRGIAPNQGIFSGSATLDTNERGIEGERMMMIMKKKKKYVVVWMFGIGCVLLKPSFGIGNFLFGEISGIWQCWLSFDPL